jgi:hypothetical protein
VDGSVELISRVMYTTIIGDRSHHFETIVLM